MSHAFLANLWFVLLALVWGIYIAQEMFISGVGILSYSYRNSKDEFKFINRSVGTHWDGVQVWLILAIGGTFAAFPKAFSTILTGLYIPIFLLLYIIIVRGLAIELIDKTNNEKLKTILRNSWFVSSILLIAVLAIYLANMFIGLPMVDGKINDSFFSFLFIFDRIPVLLAITFILYSMSLGALYLKLNSNETFVGKFDKFLKVAPLFSSLCLVVILIGFNSKTDMFVRGHFNDYLMLWALPISSAFLSMVGGLLSFFKKYKFAFFIMVLAILLFVMSGYISLSPYFIYSTVDASNSISVIEASASKYTLLVMLISTIIFLPIVIVYQTVKYVKFWRS